MIANAISIATSFFTVAIQAAQFFFREALADGYTVENQGCVTKELQRLDNIQ